VQDVFRQEASGVPLRPVKLRTGEPANGGAVNEISMSECDLKDPD
jgi:hypothetical protein